MITGEDLVEWQLRVAAGQPLPRKQDDLSINGHAIEVRIYAEDPNNDFLPATGKLKHLRTPVETAHVRIDTGVREGDEVSIYYDPMISKLIVWANTREGALRHMRKALAEYQVVGLTTNIEFFGNACISSCIREFRCGYGLHCAS
jgi:3-methylcrotonyl-CoA carboxylase alpha subunit